MRSDLQALLALSLWWTFPATAPGVAGQEAAAAAAPGCPAACSSPTALPALVVEKKTIDAGDVMRGETAHFAFVLKNTGTALLEILAKPTCGCTVAKFDKTIPPGGQGKVEAELRTSSYRTRVEKTLTLTTNDPRNPKVDLTIAVNVVPIVQVEPGPGKVVRPTAREPAVEEFRVRIRDSETAEVTGARCSASYAHAAIEPLPGGEGNGRAYRVKLTVDPSAPTGRSTFTLTITTSSKREPTAVVPIICEKGIVVAPATVFLGSIRQGAPSPESRSVILRRLEGAFRILKMETDNPNLEVREESVQDGSIHLVTISYRGDAAAPGVHRGKIRVQTDDPLQPTLQIGVLYVVAAARSTAGTAGTPPAKPAGSVATGDPSRQAAP